MPAYPENQAFNQLNMSANQGQPIRYLICAPTMRIPTTVSKTVNSYLAFRAVLRAGKAMESRKSMWLSHTEPGKVVGSGMHGLCFHTLSQLAAIGACEANTISASLQSWYHAHACVHCTTMHSGEQMRFKKVFCLNEALCTLWLIKLSRKLCLCSFSDHLKQHH